MGRDESLDALGLVGTGMVASLWGTVAGGVLGLTEGLMLGLPMAAVLGFFGDKEKRSTAPAARRGGYGHVRPGRTMERGTPVSGRGRA